MADYQYEIPESEDIGIMHVKLMKGLLVNSIPIDIFLGIVRVGAMATFRFTRDLTPTEFALLETFAHTVGIGTPPIDCTVFKLPDITKVIDLETSTGRVIGLIYNNKIYVSGILTAPQINTALNKIRGSIIVTTV